MDNRKLKVFLGGTCNNSHWRDYLISLLTIDYFNPVVEDWTEDAKDEEIKQRSICDFLLYVITPKMTGVYAIAEAVDDSNKNPDKTIFCFIDNEDGLSFSPGQIRSLGMVGKMIERNGGTWLHSLDEVAEFINTKVSKLHE